MREKCKEIAYYLLKQCFAHLYISVILMASSPAVNATDYKKVQTKPQCLVQVGIITNIHTSYHYHSFGLYQTACFIILFTRKRRKKRQNTSLKCESFILTNIAFTMEHDIKYSHIFFCICNDKSRAGQNKALTQVSLEPYCLHKTCKKRRILKSHRTQRQKHEISDKGLPFCNIISHH